MAKRPKKGKLSKRVPAALTTWLRKTNPAMRRASSVRVTRLKGGGVTIKPNPAKPYDIYVWADGGWQNVSVVYADNAAQAKRLAKQGAWKRYRIKVKKA
jgi:hypothetical protein